MLTNDNTEFVKMLVEMKEQRAKIVNECLAGKLSQNQIEEQFKGNFD